MSKHADFESSSSLALADYLGKRLHNVLTQISQEEVDVFFGRHDEPEKPTDVEKTTQEIAAEAGKLEEKEAVVFERETLVDDEPQKSTDHVEKTTQKVAAEAGKQQEKEDEEDVEWHKADQKAHEKLMMKNIMSKKSRRFSRKR